MSEKPQRESEETKLAKKNIIPDPADMAFAVWFEKLFINGLPEKLELVQIRGNNRRGLVVDTKMLKVNAKAWLKDECVRASNEWIEAAQRHCNGFGVPTKYAALATSRDSSPAPYATYLLSMKPKYGVGIDSDEVAGGETDEYDTETGLNPNKMMLERFKVWGEQDQWRIQQAHSSMGGMLKMQQETIFKLLEQNEKLMDGRFKTLEIVESVMSKMHARDMETRKQEIISKYIDEGIGAVKFFLPDIKEKLTGKKDDNNDTKKIEAKSTLETEAAKMAEITQKLHESFTPEQEHKIFGEWDKDANHLVKQGLFNENQCRLFAAAHNGKPGAARLLAKSFNPDQLRNAMKILSIEQIEMLRPLIVDMFSDTPTATTKSDPAQGA